MTVQRVDRLLGATPPASVVVRLAAYAAAALLVAGPTAVLLTPALG
jgi:hypothetical protein